MQKNILKWSFLNALGTLAYVALVVFFMSNTKNLFVNLPEYLAGITMLLLFIFSASVVGSLVLGRPILMYLEGAKREAVKLFGFTLVWLFAVLCILLVVLLALK